MGSSSLSLEAFRGAIEKAVEQRQRTYTYAAGLSVRWDADNTHAVEDVKAFQSIMRVFGFQPAEEIVIAKTNDPRLGRFAGRSIVSSPDAV